MSNKIIKVNRGDSFEFIVTIPDKKDSTKNYLLKATDALYFALLYPHQNFEDAIFIKGYSYNDPEVDANTGEIIIKVAPKETLCLAPGIYYYTVKLYQGGSLRDLGRLVAPNEVSTVIERTKFIINE